MSFDLRKGWRSDCPRCVASKLTCDEHYQPDQYSLNRIAQAEVTLSAPTFGLSPTGEITPLPGWADDRLRQAYVLIDGVMDRLNSEDEAYQLLKTARDAIENADCELS